MSNFDLSKLLILNRKELNAMYQKLDTKEITLSNTIFMMDIDTRVFQAIIFQCLAKIDAIGLQEGNLFDNLLGHEIGRVKGIYVIQDQKQNSVEVRIEINIAYGTSIPEKAQEVQNKIVEEITLGTGLRVSSVHIIFKDLISSTLELAEGCSSRHFK